MKWRRINDKNGVTAKDLISRDPEMEELLRAAKLQDSFTPDDIDVGDDESDYESDEE